MVQSWAMAATDRVKLILRVDPKVRDRLRVVAGDRLVSVNRLAEFAFLDTLERLERDPRGDDL